MRDVVVDGSALTVDDVVAVARGQARVKLADDVPKRMEKSRSVVVEALRGDAPVYGVNTGFGALADTPVGEADLTTLQGAIVRSHAAATGAPLDDETVRAILLLRARTLAAGYSGVRADLPARLLELLSLDLLPVIPGKGSVGASGDLAQLAHLAQPLIGEGRLRSPGDPADGRPAGEVLREHGLEPLTLAPKEGLSLVNGTEPMQALLAFSVHDAAMLVQAADVACGLSVEALLGTDRPYDERVQVIRPHPGQLVSAANLRGLLAGSGLLASHRHSRHAVQDAYCLRCAPQVHGAVRDVLTFARQILITELHMTCLIEVHDMDNLMRVRDHVIGFPHRSYSLLGINNRDLRTFKTDLGTTMRMADLVADKDVLVSESGINDQDDVRKLANEGVRAALVGESLMRADDVTAKIRDMFFE